MYRTKPRVWHYRYMSHLIWGLSESSCSSSRLWKAWLPLAQQEGEIPVGEDTFSRWREEWGWGQEQSREQGGSLEASGDPGDQSPAPLSPWIA